MQRRAAIAAAAVLAGCAPDRDCTVAVWLVDPSVPDDADVAVVGDFDGWNPTADPMEPVEPGAWRADLVLPAGDYRYAISVDGLERPDPFAALVDVDDDSGEVRSVLRVEDCGPGALDLASALATPDGGVVVTATFLRGDAPLDPGSVRATLDGAEVPVDVRKTAGRLTVDLSGVPVGKHTVELSASDRDGLAAEPLVVPLWVEPTPFDWNGATIYQIVVDRYAGPDGAVHGDDPGARFGGNLPGVTRAIEAGTFDALGVSALWLSPLYRNPDGWWETTDGRHTITGYHGYWPISPDGVEPALGTEDDLHALVAAAHARGIRVLLDIVPNHVHQDHPYRTLHADDGWFHENPDCLCGNYDCPWSNEIGTCWFTGYLPDLALENPDVAATVVADTVGWARRFDVDGFRVDAVPMLRIDGLRALTWGLRRALDQGPTRFFLVGETFTGADGADAIAMGLGPFGLDGQFEFPTLWALRSFVRDGDAGALEATIAESEARYAGSGAVMSPFLGNHDMVRFTTAAAGDDPGDPWTAPPPQPADPAVYRRVLVGHAVVLGLPGAPVLYYGDELGLAGGNDPDNRRAMPAAWSSDQQWLLDRVGRIGRTRACSDALRRGVRLPLLADGPVLAFARATPGERALIVVNGSGTAQVVGIPGESGSWFDVVEQEPGLDPAQLTMPAWSARVLVPSDAACSGGDR